MLSIDWGPGEVQVGVELIGVPLAESVEFASFADSTNCTYSQLCYSLISANPMQRVQRPQHGTI